MFNLPAATKNHIEAIIPHKKIYAWRLMAISIAAALFASSCSTTHQVPAYKNTALTTEVRVDDLIRRMSLEEKALQMQNQSPAIERLGIPEYNWWTEGLHGVARAGLATVFPQAIGLAATWDEDLMHDVASAIGDEARAKHHAFAAKGKRNIYQGLTIWSPNINIFRDPRWGRGQETYGEDPFLTGKLAVQFIQGLQGNDEQYLKTVATVKHFAVHNGPEPERHSFNAVISTRELYQNYLPQFEVALKEGGAQSVMCAYNRFNGEPACASPTLLQSILREDWRFNGFVVSDCGAIEDIHKYHKVTQTEAQSAAISVKAGTDLNCGKMYKNLPAAVSEGLITEAEIDVALKRLLRARMQLGMFDAPESVEYANIPYHTVNSKKHQALALKAARHSMVLLKNDNNTLPLKKDLKSIAVIGPNANQWLTLLGNYNGVPEKAITPLEGIQQAVSKNTTVTYAQGSELADGIPMFYTVPSHVLSHKNKLGLAVDFFNQASIEGTPLYSAQHALVDINWQDKAPRQDMDDDNFAVRWRGQLTPEVSGAYKLGVRSTCNTNVYLNGEKVVNTAYHFRDEYGDPRHKSSDWIQLEAGKSYNIEITARETYADASVQLVWAAPKNKLQEKAIALAKKSDAIVLVMGLTPQMEGEEMDVDVDGFRGGDRTKISLPRPQQELIKAVSALKKPTVLVALNGSALAINWAQEHIPAIVEAWYPGQAAGTAIADILFGDYNPAGRLPVTFYKSVADLPPFEDYTMSSQTYRYFKKEPLYPFGYGLSFSHFEYSQLKIPTTTNTQANIEVSVTLENQSNYAGEEVLQVYVTRKNREQHEPLRSLAAFKRIHLEPNTPQTITLNIAKETFSVFNDAGQRIYPEGEFIISVGGGQPDQTLQTSSNVLTKTLLIKN